MLNLETVLHPVHRAGWPFIIIALGITFVLLLLSKTLGILGILVTAFIVYFFRDPDRVTPTRDGLIISPADGRIQMITTAVPPKDLKMGDSPLSRISIFLNIFNVHVNRMPADGMVDHVEYHEGQFLNASTDKSSEDNERNSVRLRLKSGRHVGIVQIAGYVARRIVCDTKVGDEVEAGQRFGIIRFGSRVDVYLPEGVIPLVIVGQTAIGGETILADMLAKEISRNGEVR